MQPAYPQSARADRILFRIDTLQVTADEFMYAMNKNNYSGKKLTREDVDNYLSLYRNFKLKVCEAYSQGKDTSSAFLREYNMYKKQLDDTYLQNDSWLDSMAEEVYERLKYVIRASHVLINIRNPSDTTSSWARIREVYNLARNGADFGELAIRYSEDPSARYNSGDIGFFTALQLVLPFENMAYLTPVGGISEPFRTRYGYHILKVMDKRPNPGSVNVAHIMLSYRPGMNGADSLAVRQAASDIYMKIMNGEDWDKLCAGFSEDNNTKNNGGRIPEFGAGRMVPSFSDASFALQSPGDISPPVPTPYGLHIIKLIGKTPLRGYNEMKNELREQIRQDERYSLVRKSYLDHLAGKNRYARFEEVFKECILLADSSLARGKWDYDSTLALSGKTIVEIDNRKYSAKEFLGYIKKNQTSSGNMNPEIYMTRLFEDFREKILTDYERDHLASQYPEYRWLVKEYREGIHMFNQMDEKVWQRAALDSTGMVEYFKHNREKYSMDESAEATIIMTNDTLVLNSIAREIDEIYFQKSSKKWLSDNYSDYPGLILQIDTGIYEKGTNEILNMLEWNTGKYYLSIDDKEYYVLIENILPGRPKTFGESRADLISDYQEYLEKVWIKDLEKRFPVIVNKKSLKEIYREFED
ncbi:MAG TPA: peptidylprolyl isomerase [Cyclobacteriaceae bacterium]|nr:peptidylprolyl isomerase [Cyclobacteriaceae bacterium]